jgi:alpha-1,2-mannosyltransferase
MKTPVFPQGLRHFCLHWNFKFAFAIRPQLWQTRKQLDAMGLARTQIENRIEQSVKPPEPRRWQLFACLTILGLALTSSFETSAERAFAIADDIIPSDFAVFYLGGKVALQRGATPLYYPPADRSQGYTLLFQNADEATPWAKMARAEGLVHAMQFTNPPFSAVLMAPLAMMPWQWAYVLWQIITISLTAAAIFLTLRLIPSGPTLETFAVIFAAACFFFPLRNTLVCGQVNVAILFFWTLGVLLLKRRRAAVSALCFAFGTVLKVSPAFAVPLFALRRQWRWLAAYLMGVAAFTGVSIWRLGWQTHLTWLTAIYPSISSGVGSHINRSFAGLVDALCGPGYFATLTTNTEWPVPPGLSLFEKACSLAIALGFLFWCWRKRRDAKGLVDELILLPLVYLLAAPFSWPHHFDLAILPLTYLWAKAREATSAELVALYLSTMVLGTELPMEIAAYSPWANSNLIIVAIALWPAATCALIWVGMRMSLRSQAVEPQLGAAI